MWATLTLSAALGLAPAQAGELRISNERATYGYLGPIRTDSKLLPGDAYFVAFDIDGLKVTGSGDVYYKMGMVIKNSQGKEQFKQESIEHRALLSLGGTRVPAFAHATIGTDTPPGDYLFEVTVSDPATKKEVSLKRKFQVEGKRFGIVRLNMSYDQGGYLSAPPLAAVGQSFLVNFMVVGFERGGKDKQPDIAAEFRVLDDKGKPTLPEPLKGEVNKEVPEKMQVLPMQFVLSLNRAGKFTLMLKATDRLTKKSVEQSFDIQVVELK